MRSEERLYSTGDFGEPRVRVLSLVTRASEHGGIPRVVHEIVSRSGARIDHHLCQIRPFTEDPPAGLHGKATVHTLGLEEQEAPLGRAVAHALGNVRFARLVGRVQPDVVHLHTGTSLVAALARLRRGRRSSWILDFHEPLDVRHSGLTTRAVYEMARRGSFTGVTHSSAVSRKLTEALGPTVPLVPIPLGVDTAALRAPAEDRLSWRRRHGWDAAAPLVVSVGRIAEMKGAPELLEVARRVLDRNPAVQFAFIGTGPLLDDLRERARVLRIDCRARFLGFLPDMTSALAASDVYLSTSRYEGFGIAVLEAMAVGLPVVATRIDGLIDLVVEGHTGALSEVGDIDAYAREVLALVERPEERIAKGRAGSNRARELFDISVTVAAYERLYVELARTRPGAPKSR